jgi:predicted deacylase
MGADFYIPVHIVAGVRPGPVLGVINAVHGDEVLPIPAMRDVVAQVNPKDLAGTLVVVPVANPIAFAAGSRQTPDTWDRNNLWRAFPGNPKGTITEQMGAVLSEQVISGLDVLIEVHSGGIGRLQNRVEYDGRLSAELKKRTFDLAVAFGTELVHESPVPTDGPTGYFNAEGRPGFQVEVGCSFLSPAEDTIFRSSISRGVVNVMKFLNMLEGNPVLPERQIWFPREGVRTEVHPSEGGYLISHKAAASDLGAMLEEGEVLGEMFDPYSYETLEELSSPVKGLLVYSRLSGPMEAGNKGFAIARLDGTKRIKDYSLQE